ncbi:hypothetical protein [Rhodoferax sp.]|uniref:hypothetical protein n=1 Tax=Rhodoferax sp. TaxID=50421 RepID=UPI0026015A2C|nr:hypothetical protein [Rhodoferax sp.]
MLALVDRLDPVRGAQVAGVGVRQGERQKTVALPGRVPGVGLTGLRLLGWVHGTEYASDARFG